MLMKAYMPSLNPGWCFVATVSRCPSCLLASLCTCRYTRADGIAMLILKRSSLTTIPRWTAKEPYAQIVNIGTNNDGHTKEGITFPSATAQGALARQVVHLLLLHQPNTPSVKLHLKPHQALCLTSLHLPAWDSSKSQSSYLW